MVFYASWRLRRSSQLKMFSIMDGVIDSSPQNSKGTPRSGSQSRPIRWCLFCQPDLVDSSQSLLRESG